jgi:hypothetical protein
MFQHNVALVLMHRGIICGVPLLYLVPWRGCTCPMLHVSVSVFQLIVSPVSVECFICFKSLFQLFCNLEYMDHMQMNVVTHQNTLATFRMSLGTMFIKVFSPNYATKYCFPS